jgi:hypothetical protein
MLFQISLNLQSKGGAYPIEAPFTYPQTLDEAVKGLQGQIV